MSEINWHTKYKDLKAKYMNDVELSFRLGMEQGLQQGKLQSQQQQMQPQLQSPQGPQMEGSQAPELQQPGQEIGQGNGDQGSELDQHIQKLESMISKSEDLNMEDLKKTIQELKFAQEMKKSYAAIPKIAQALHTPSFKYSQQANHNLSTATKHTNSLQKKIVDDIFKSWEEQEQNASKDILSQLGIDGLNFKKD